MKTEPNEPISPKISTHEREQKYGVGTYGEVYSEGGLTKREYFAGLAMQRILVDSEDTASQIATMAVQFADALISELNK